MLPANFNEPPVTTGIERLVELVSFGSPETRPLFEVNPAALDETRNWGTTSVISCGVDEFEPLRLIKMVPG